MTGRKWLLYFAVVGTAVGAGKEERKENKLKTPPQENSFNKKFPIPRFFFLDNYKKIEIINIFECKKDVLKKS